MTLTEIANRIDAHLRRMENDPAINMWHGGREGGTRPYFYARAWRAGRYVGVVYIDYQGSERLEREEAERYLAWLDGGNNGKHYSMLKQEAAND